MKYDQVMQTSWSALGASWSKIVCGCIESGLIAWGLVWLYEFWFGCMSFGSVV